MISIGVVLDGDEAIREIAEVHVQQWKRYAAGPEEIAVPQGEKRDREPEDGEGEHGGALAREPEDAGVDQKHRGWIRSEAPFDHVRASSGVWAVSSDVHVRQIAQDDPGLVGIGDRVGAERLRLPDPPEQGCTVQSMTAGEPRQRLPRHRENRQRQDGTANGCGCGTQAGVQTTH